MTDVLQKDHEGTKNDNKQQKKLPNETKKGAKP